MLKSLFATVLALADPADREVRAPMPPPTMGTIGPGSPMSSKRPVEDNYSHCGRGWIYAPGQHAGLAGPGSYWYQRAYHHRHHHRHHHYSTSRHVAWCLDRYRTYDPHSDTFVGKGYHRYRCRSPY